MSKISKLIKSRQIINVGIFGLSFIGILLAMKSWQGNQTTLVEYCFLPKKSHCKPYQRYVMSKKEFESGKFSPSNPLLQREVFISSYATKIREIPATNPYKPLWGLGSITVMGIAWALNREVKKSLVEMLPCYRSSVQASWSIAQVENARKIESAIIQAEIHLRKEQNALQEAPEQLDLSSLSKKNPSSLGAKEEEGSLIGII